MRKKKFDDQAGFLWNTIDIQAVQRIADARSLTPSDIYREAMRIYLAIQDGSATLTYIRPAQATPVTSVTENPNQAGNETPATQASAKTAPA